jgi:uncharacterized membrane protein YphA (DoxX/SURF4 family)
MLNRSTRFLLAALQAVLGWEWLMSAGNKVLSGSFPQGLADTLNDGIKNNPNTWYAAFLQQNILPHSIFYGYLIEWTEMVIAIFLLGGAFILVSRSHMPDDVWYAFGLTTSIAVAIVAVIGAFLTVNFHFWTGGWIFPIFRPGAANGEGIDLDALLPPLSLVVTIANIALFRELQRAGVLKRSIQFAEVGRAGTATE